MDNKCLIDTNDMQRVILNYINSEDFTKMFNGTVFANNNDCRNAMIHGMVVASMVVSSCTQIPKYPIKKENSIEPTKWIMCQDKVPPNDETVLVNILDDSGDNPGCYTTVGNYDFTFNIWIVDNEVTSQVIAWQPYPKALDI